MTINARLKADSLPVCETTYSYVRLINDCRWPWFVVIPKEPDATELHHLGPPQRLAYLDDINHLGACLQQLTGCRSINIGMLGNVVSALHCHVVARDTDDPNWPDPVWGYGNAVAYDSVQAQELIDSILAQLSHAA